MESTHYPNRLESLCLGSIFTTLGIGFYYATVDKKMFEAVYVLEDGLIEWATVGILFSGFCLCLYRVFNLRKVRRPWFLFCTLLLALIFLFGAGEEISWGQRMSSNRMASEFFVKHNTQQETTFHNLVVGGVRLNKVVFGTGLGIFMGIYLLLFGLMDHKWKKFHKFISSFAIPLPRYHHILAFILMFILVNLVPSGKKGELTEFAGSFLFLMIVLNPVNSYLFWRDSSPAAP
ncbi:MAG: hypothetical protein HOE90_01905 [Bacteriovoracaceae bacterium]|jgi:hypothetical protein|nr:hypothetical protein [Bacteriovoracaceae bacterium]